MTKRIQSYDVLRGIVMFLVVFGHLERFQFNMEVKPFFDYFLPKFRMPIFFFISGLFFSLNKCNSVKEILVYTLKKAPYLLIPTFVFYFLYSYVNGTPLFDFVDKGFGKYWFLPTLFECILLLSLTELLTRVLKIPQEDLLLLIVTVIVIGVSFFNSSLRAIYFPFFAFGYLMRKHKDFWRKMFLNNIFAFISFVMMIGILIAQRELKGALSVQEDELLYKIQRYFVTFFVLSCFFHYQEYFDRNNKLNNYLSFVGNYTLPIYVLHYFFLPNLEWLHKLIGYDSEIVTIALLILITMGIIAMCVFVTKIVSRIDFLGHYILGQNCGRYKK